MSNTDLLHRIVQGMKKDTLEECKKEFDEIFSTVSVLYPGDYSIPLWDYLEKNQSGLSIFGIKIHRIFTRANQSNQSTISLRNNSYSIRFDSTGVHVKNALELVDAIKWSVTRKVNEMYSLEGIPDIISTSNIKSYDL
jgi:hypothetical protein